MLIEQLNSDLGGYQMGPNKKDAVLQTTEMLNSVFATAGSYPHEGGYVYVGFPVHGHFVFFLPFSR